MSDLTVRQRIKRLGIAWGVAFAPLLVVGTPLAALFLPVFPGGLITLPRDAGLCCQGRIQGYVILGWIVYALLSISLLVIPDRRLSFKLLLLLCVLLALNVVGCVIEGGKGSA